jgi:serine/threonine protein kinase
MGTTPPPKAPDPSVKVGDLVLERYRVAEQIASGGHSVVFRGTDERLSRPVCIKVFSGLGGKSGVGRTSYEHFVQEAFALSRLTHPNTLRIYDFGHLGQKDAEGMPLQVCEYMNGGTLSQIVREQGKQSLAETTRVIGAMCAALAEAHALGIVHRDIKPQNILFGTVGGSKLPKLADFGIAKWSADAADQEDSNRAEDTAIVAGQKLAMYSPSWAAPEQLAGQPVSAQTDIYSLAVVAVYMLSGKAIFADEDVYAGYKKRRHADELVKDALLPQKVPKQAIALITKALAFDPKRRLESVEQLQQGLLAALEPSDETKKRMQQHQELTGPVQPHTPTTPTPALTPPMGLRPPTLSEVTERDLDGQLANLPVTQLTARKQQPTAPPLPGSSAKPPTTPPATTPAGAAPRPTPQPTPPPYMAPTPYVPHDSPAWQPPTMQQPWMAIAPTPSGAPRRLQLMEAPQLVSDRRVHFVHTTGYADLVGGQGKVRVTFLSSPTGGLLIHLKGMSCFVAPLGGRPSPAVQLEQPADVALVTPRAQEIGHIRVAVGVQTTGLQTFPIGYELVAIGSDDCMDPILFDFGPGSDAYFVYTRGRPVPKPHPAHPRRR